MDPIDRAQNSKLFTFFKFENLSTGSKIIGNQSWVLFAKNLTFLQTFLKEFYRKIVSVKNNKF